MKYLVTHIKSKKTMLFTYCDNGFLIAYKSDFVMKPATVNFLKATFPFIKDDLQHYRNSKEFKVDLIKQDLSFKNFWQTYNYKVGNKSRTIKLWDALNETDKAKAFNYINRYNNWLNGANGISKLYPMTYLHQRRFDND